MKHRTARCKNCRKIERLFDSSKFGYCCANCIYRLSKEINETTGTNLV